MVFLFDSALKRGLSTKAWCSLDQDLLFFDDELSKYAEGRMKFTCLTETQHVQSCASGLILMQLIA